MWKAVVPAGALKRQDPRDEEAVHDNDASSLAAERADTRNAPAMPVEDPSAQSSSAIAASVYNGTGLRVVTDDGEQAHSARSCDSVISLYSNEDIDFDDLASRTSSDDSSDLTALGTRGDEMETCDNSSNIDRYLVEESSLPLLSSSMSSDDMVTPGLHTANMSALHFGTTPTNNSNSQSTGMNDSQLHSPRLPSNSYRNSVPPSPGAPPITLASYLSSTLSSPGTRSYSSGSLASFPTDLLSDISRAESVVDTDDAGSEFNSDSGGDPSASTSHLPHSRGQDVMRHSDNLVIPKLSTTSSGDPGSSASSTSERSASAPPPESRQATRARPAGQSVTRNPESTLRPRILLVGGTAKQQGMLKAALRHRNDKQARSLDKTRLSFNIESVESLAAAGERAERPFTVLQSVLRPEIANTDASLLENLLPNLLDQVAAVSVCLLILEVPTDKSLAQHISEQFQQLHHLSKLTALLPVLIEKDGIDGRDSVSQMTQGNIDWLGRNKHGKIGFLKARARPYRIEELQGLAEGLVEHSFIDSTVRSFQRWNTPASASPLPGRSLRRRSTAVPPAQMGSTSRPAPSSSEPQSPMSQDHSASLDLPSMSSSMVERLSVPPSSGGDSTSRTSDVWNAKRVSSARQERPCHPSHLDPLHLPSLLQLVGLNMATKFSSFAFSVKTFFQCFVRQEKAEVETEAQVIRRMLHFDAVTARQAKAMPALTGSQYVRPFFGCARWRYSPKGEDHYYHEDKSACQRCVGIMLAGLVVGIALWFS